MLGGDRVEGVERLPDPVKGAEPLSPEVSRTQRWLSAGQTLVKRWSNAGQTRVKSVMG